jgi:hypothetical protein
MHLFAGSFHFANAVIDDQPTVPRQDGRSAAADFEPLPRRHWSRQPVTRKLAEVTRFTELQGKRAVGGGMAFEFLPLRSAIEAAAYHAFFFCPPPRFCESGTIRLQFR